jgi:hypothetical protein
MTRGGRLRAAQVRASGSTVGDDAAVRQGERREGNTVGDNGGGERSLACGRLLYQRGSRIEVRRTGAPSHFG